MPDTYSDVMRRLCLECWQAFSHMMVPPTEQCSRSPTWFDKVLAQNSLHEYDLFKPYNMSQPCTLYPNMYFY